MERLRLSSTRSIHTDDLEPTWTNAQVKRGADQLIKRELVQVEERPTNRRIGIWRIDLNRDVCR
jgi:hypothetical protein